MNKILLAFILISTCAFSQTTSSKLLPLENSIRTVRGLQNLNETAGQNVSVGKKNAGLAILYSLLLPGMGELYAGSYSSGKYFTIAEGAIWGAYIGMNAYGNWQKNRYKAFAASTGGVNLQGKDDTFFATIGNYMNVAEYNNAQALSGNFNELYSPKTFNWSWQTNAQRQSYRDMWVAGEQAHNNLRFVVGALILNRVASAINAVRLVAAYNKRQSAELGWNVSVGVSNPPTLPSSLTFNFQTGF